MVHLFAWFLAYAEQMFVSKRRHVLRRWNLSRRREYAREKKKNGREKEYHRNENQEAKESRTS